DAVFYLLELRDLAATLRSQRGVTTGALAAAVTLLSVTLAVGQDSFEGQNGRVSAFLGAAVISFFFTFSFYKFKPFQLGLVLPEVWDVGIEASIFAVLERLSAAAAGLPECYLEHGFHARHPGMRQESTESEHNG